MDEAPTPPFEVPAGADVYFVGVDPGVQSEVQQWIVRYGEQWHRENGLADMRPMLFPMPRPNTQLAEAIERINREIIAGMGLPSALFAECNRPADAPEPVDFEKIYAEYRRIRDRFENCPQPLASNNHVDHYIQVDRAERKRRQKNG